MDSLEFYSKMNFIGSHITVGASVAQAASDNSSNENFVKAVTEQIIRELGK